MVDFPPAPSSFLEIDKLSSHQSGLGLNAALSSSAVPDYRATATAKLTAASGNSVKQECWQTPMNSLYVGGAPF